ncbi:hypothetical protein [uncultured Desulfovibrio sp.]|uniref:hypothetical protein n=1 Tax=uncultured Desulfovibrio sp. TaxID=167968 RepID=UPI00261AEDFD|nr:hypothetical protein [uncultured Desulfovibrio sp.]
MKKDFLAYLTGLCQAASAALLASAVIVPEARAEALLMCYLCAGLGMLFVFLKNKEG